MSALARERLPGEYGLLASADNQPLKVRTRPPRTDQRPCKKLSLGAVKLVNWRLQYRCTRPSGHRAELHRDIVARFLPLRALRPVPHLRSRGHRNHEVIAAGDRVQVVHHRRSARASTVLLGICDGRNRERDYRRIGPRKSQTSVGSIVSYQALLNVSESIATV